MEHNLQWKMAFDGRQSSMVDDLQCKMTYERENRASELEGFLNWSLLLFLSKKLEPQIKS